jgi:hypothetical protein
MKWADTQLTTGSAAEFVAVKVSALLPKAALDAAGNLPKFHTTTKLLIFSTNQIIHNILVPSCVCNSLQDNSLNNLPMLVNVCHEKQFMWLAN